VEPNLPIHLTSFLGRERELNEVSKLLVEDRIVTLVGPAGAGKTRLAIEVARPLAETQSDGAWFVDLAPLFDAALLAPTVAAAMGLDAATPDLEHLCRHLADREAIVLLDNAEHLVDGVAAAAEALAHGCPGIRLLVTSREPLGVEGEWTYRVGPLAEHDAIRLFVDRARHADTGFTPTDATAETVAQICRRLDGIPLALELCAACAGSMAPERILQRLDERFGLLVGVRRTAVARHRTMRAAIEWSEALLSDAERRLFRRLSVFAGDFDVDAAEVVAAAPDLPVAEVLPLLRRLIERSLVLLLRNDEGERYHLLESLREFGRERLEAAGEAEALAIAHARHYTGLAHSLSDSYYRSHERIDPAPVERHLANFRVALEFATDHDPAWLADLAGALAPLWLQIARVEEGRQWMEAGLACAPRGSEQRFRLLTGLVDVGVRLGDFAHARSWADEALQNRRQCGDERGGIHALLLLSMVTALSGDPEGSLVIVREAIDLARRLNEPHNLARALNNLAMSLMAAGQDAAVAEQFAMEAVGLARTFGAGTLGPPFHLEARLDTLANAHLRRGRIDAALAAQREALGSAGLSEYQTVWLLPTMAALLIACGQPRRGVRLAGAIDRYCEQVGLKPSVAWEINRTWLERGLAALGRQAAAVRASGRRFGLEEARAYALEEASGDEPGAAATLSRREIQVAGLVREGLSNRAIAQRLFISPRTAEYHVEQICNKLGVRSRAEVAAWVADNVREENQR
jgi:non-specific serine/threonine protein kinase